MNINYPKILIITILSLSAMILAIMFAPLLYKVPYFDDFLLSSRIAERSFFEVCSHYYFNWSGRYATFSALALITPNPEGMLFKYAPLIMFTLSIGVWTKIFAQNEWFQMTIPKAFFVTFSILSLYYAYLPEPFSGLYWNCASFYLQFPFYIGLLISALNLSVKPIYKQLAVSVIVIWNAGTFELLIMLQCLTLFWFLIYNWSVVQKRKELLFYLFIAIIFALVNVLAPGNFTRVDASQAGVESVGFVSLLAKTIYYNIVLDYGMVIGLKNGLLISVIIYLLIRLFANKLELPTISKQFFWLSLFSFVGMFFLMHCLFVIIAGYPMVGRVLNTVLFVYLLLIPIYLLLAEQLYFKDQLAVLKNVKTPILILLMIFEISTLVSGERKKIMTSTVRELPEFYETYTNKINALKSNPKDTSRIHFKVQPSAFKLNFHPDSVNDFNSEGYNNEMKSYFENKK